MAAIFGFESSVSSTLMTSDDPVLATVASLGGDVTDSDSRVLCMSRYLGHTDSQSEKAKAGAINLASTNRPFTNWRLKMHGL